MGIHVIVDVFAIIGVIGGLVGIILLIRQIKDSTSSKYIDFLFRSYEKYVTEEMLKAVRLVRETPIEKYQKIVHQGKFTSDEWVARRKVSAYWQVIALLARKKYIDLDLLFRLTHGSVSIFKKLHEIRMIPNPHYQVYDLNDVKWLYEKFLEWDEKFKKDNCIHTCPK